MPSTTVVSGPSKPLAAISMVVLGAAGAYITVVLPAIVQQLVTSVGFTGTQANQIVTAEKFGMMAASLGLSFLIRKLNRRWLAMAFLVMLAVANGVCGELTGFTAYASARFVCGVAEGGLIAIMTASAAERGIAERVFGWYLAVTLAISYAAFQLVIPGVLESSGLPGLFHAMSAFTVLVLLLVPFLPAQMGEARGDEARDAAPIKAGPNPARKWIAMALGATLLFEACIGAVWNNITLIAEKTGYLEAEITGGLANAMIVGIVAGMASGVLGDKFGRRLPLSLGVGAILFSQLLLRFAPGQAPFVVVAMMFFFAWFFTLPYFVGAVAALDPTGRSAVASIVVQTGGLMLGPLIAAEVIRGNDAYPNILWVGLASAALCLIMVLPAVGRRALDDARAHGH
jgi:predicted MFS family arabinose efflux permease